MKSKYKVIDLFCGIGGFSYGFEKTGEFEVLVGADIWETALNTFKKNHPQTKLIHQDITQLDENYWAPYKDKIDVIIAGPPCQGFSMSGQRKVNDRRNSLFKEVVRITEIIQPKYVVIENVVGLLSMTNSEGLDIKGLIKDEFAKIGYNVAYKILNAADYGVPQSRKRVIFMISKTNPLTYPAPKNNQKNYVTVGNALGNIPVNGTKYLPAETEFQKLMEGTKEIHNHEPISHAKLIVERMSHVPQGGNWRDIPLELGQGGGQHSNNYRRLDANKPSITIKHATKSMLIHPFCDRTPTVREVARLQSFDDNFILTGSKSDQHQQLANAVPPLLGLAIAEEIAKNLNNSGVSHGKV